MSSLISDAQKSTYKSIIDNIHDTFKRLLMVYKEGTKIVISSDPNYSHIYEQPSDNVQIQTSSRQISARIYYFPRYLKKEEITPTGGDTLALRQNAEQVRLRMSKDDFDFVKDAERFVFDDHTYTKSSTEVPTGLFADSFYTLYLRRVS